MDREAIGAENIHAALDALLNLPPLKKSPQLSAFLAYVVRESLAGRGSLLKSYTIATDALGRSTSFDPATDAIVRVEARRLRQVLQQIYADPACPLDVRIDLPLGRYEPSFRQIAPAAESSVPSGPQAPATGGVQESEQRYRALVEASAAVEWRSGPDGSLTQTFGLSARTGLCDTELQGFGWLSTLHPDDRNTVEALWRACCLSGTPLDATYRVRHRNGQYRWMLGRAVPLENAEGAIREWVGTMADIDEQVRAAEALRTSEERLRLAMAAAEMMTWDIDLSTREVTCSEIGESLMGVTTGPLDEFLAMILPEDLPAVLASLEPALRGEGTYDAQYRITDHEGHVRWLSARGSVMTASDGRRRLIGVACDISSRYINPRRTGERRMSA
ncbi:PAS domain S-box protein [Methylobacterium currus]|uniref:histidine kinase n=1 Tax=Methylobacterium currus TaxID=2051553 RepID=A0A2R4WRD7_9HYPH|nr:PAS domain-containing protein [Methylobacterium currus]AWB24111.1 PAS domain S-box protein [Methylobacterium currus]UHC15946.1 PAS domain-containing protein [Methylobacterium currus]